MRRTERRVIWPLSMPACAEMNRAIVLELTGVSYSTGEQNKGIRKSRQARDMKDTPFATHTDLINNMPKVLLMWKRPEKSGRASWIP